MNEQLEREDPQEDKRRSGPPFPPGPVPASTNAGDSDGPLEVTGGAQTQPVEIPLPTPVSTPERAASPPTPAPVPGDPAQPAPPAQPSRAAGPSSVADRRKKHVPKRTRRKTIIRSTRDIKAILARTYPDPETGKELRAPGVAQVVYEYLLFLAAKALGEGGNPGEIAVTDGRIMSGVKKITGRPTSKTTAKRCRAFLRAAGLLIQEPGEKRQARGRAKGQDLLDTPATVVEVRDNADWFRNAAAPQSLSDLLDATRRAKRHCADNPAFVTLLDAATSEIQAELQRRTRPKSDSSPDPIQT